MNPKKPSEITKMISETDHKLVSELISFYWKEVRKSLSNCKGANIVIEGLGTFRAKSWKLPDVITETEKMRDKYKAIVDAQTPITFQKFAILKDYEEKLEQLNALKVMIEEDELKKQQVKDKRNEQTKRDMEPPQADS